MDMPPGPLAPPMALIVRLRRASTGHLRGFVEHPRTGAKEAFDGLDDVAGAIGRLLKLDTPRPARPPEPGVLERPPPA
jgi:hypothetical protein